MEINSLRIRNYRCLKDVEIPNLSKITLLVGRNNTGKSAFIEAAALASTADSGWYDALGDDLLERIVENRGGIEHAELMIRIGSNEAEITSKNEKESRVVKIAKDLRQLPERAQSIVLGSIDAFVEEAQNEEIVRLGRTKKYDARSYELLLHNLERKIAMAKREAQEQAKAFVAGIADFDPDREPETATLFSWPPEVVTESDFVDFIPMEEIIRSSPQRESSTLFSVTPSFENFQALHRRLARSGKLADLIGKLRKRVDYFLDIREIEEDILVYLKNQHLPIPLQSMGDGFSYVLSMLTEIEIAKGLVLLEEPETCLHPGFMKIVVDHLVDSASKENVQYIISTHSSDFIDLLVESPPELFSVVRFQAIEGTADIDYQVLSGAQAKEESKELKMELRGA